MRKRIMIMLYTVASMIDDIAYFVVGKGAEIDCEIKTFWGEHYYGQIGVIGFGETHKFDWTEI